MTLPGFVFLVVAFFLLVDLVALVWHRLRRAHR